jgi:predicted nucleic acid-binding protein
LIEPEPQVVPCALVLDTNAVLEGWAFADPRMAPVVAALSSGRARWLAAERMRDELADVLARPALVHRGEGLQRTLAAFDDLARLCPDPPSAGVGLVCRDADDQIFLDLALAEGASWLVTRDKALLELHRRACHRGLAIVTPEAWLPWLPGR